MTRMLLLAAATLSLAGCRSSCGSNCYGLFNRGSSQATPVSTTGPMTTYPASMTSGFPVQVTAQPASFPVIPPPSPNAVELPFPSETIPPATLPVSGAPRGVSLPK